jgi:hypothetical protein
VMAESREEAVEAWPEACMLQDSMEYSHTLPDDEDSRWDTEEVSGETKSDLYRKLLDRGILSWEVKDILEELEGDLPEEEDDED